MYNNVNLKELYNQIKSGYKVISVFKKKNNSEKWYENVCLFLARVVLGRAGDGFDLQSLASWLKL